MFENVMFYYNGRHLADTPGTVLREAWGRHPRPHSKLYPVPPNEVHHVDILTEVYAIASLGLQALPPPSVSMAPPWPPPFWHS